MREKRKIILGAYDTVRDGPWTLASWSFPEPKQQTNVVDVPGRQDGPLDMSTVLTNGEPTYGSRTLTADLECSEGTRMDREAQISTMLNQLDGRQMRITLPDDPLHYVVGRVSIKKQYNDMAHAAVKVTATCAPWRYNWRETVITVAASETELLTVLPNSGRRIVTPDVTVEGTGAEVVLSDGSIEWTLPEGDYKLVDLSVPPGSTPLTVRGKGTVILSYREAVL